jgi:predicted metal-dependent hydrolase
MNESPTALGLIHAREKSASEQGLASLEARVGVSARRTMDRAKWPSLGEMDMIGHMVISYFKFAFHPWESSRFTTKFAGDSPVNGQSHGGMVLNTFNFE